MLGTGTVVPNGNRKKAEPTLESEQHDFKFKIVSLR
jgi:hypothetical protein